MFARREQRWLQWVWAGIVLLIVLVAMWGLEDHRAPRGAVASEEAEGGRKGAMHPEVLDYLYQTYRDPATGIIPPGVRSRELAYAETLPAYADGFAKATAGPRMVWVEAGPRNVGGRTRALAVDVTDPATVLAGAVSGGMWKSTDEGATWRLVSRSGQHLGVTALAQDPRPGHTTTWYYGAGEFRGALTTADRGFRALYYGTGIYKSDDNGETWTLLPATEDADPTSHDSAFDFVHRIVVSPVTGTVFVANNGSGVYRSNDGGSTWTLTLGGIGDHAWSDVAVATDGTLVATLSSNALLPGAQTFQPGVYRSTDDGQTWARITPSTFPSVHQRSVIAVAPSNPEVAYVLTFVDLNGRDGAEDIRFHKFHLPSGAAQDRSAHLPRFTGDPGQGAALHSWFNFTMMLAVKPDDEDFVLVGGVTLFRSTDGFATPPPSDVDATRIGGLEAFTPNVFNPLYPNHHPDNHVVAFNPQNPNEVWSGHDGGISLTRDVTQSRVVWEDKNNGYHVTQFYGVAVGDEAGDGRIFGGTQDNGTMLLADQRNQPGNSADFSAARAVTRGDGAYGYLGDQHLFVSLGTGVLARFNYLSGSETAVVSGIGFAPTGASGQLFVPPFAVDPADERIMYYPAGNVIWRNDNLEATNPRSAWRRLDAISAPTGYAIRPLAVSVQPPHTLYFGASHSQGPPRIYRLDQAHTATDGLQEISIPNVPGGAYVHSIAVNPENADEILVAFSNYNIVGLYHSTDGGQTYTAVEGNLEGDATLPGPSLRSVGILPLAAFNDPRTLYVVGTSAGLFSTSELDGAQTVWRQEAADLMGNAIVEHLAVRASDGRVVAGTHGRGLFVGDVDATSVAREPDHVLPEGFALAQNYPNPFNPSTEIRFTLAAPGQVTLTVFDVNGRTIQRLLADATRTAGEHTVSFDGAGLASGVYLYRLEVRTGAPRIYTATKSMVLQK